MNYHVANFIDQRARWKKGICTFQLQYKSLQYFLGELGYVIDYCHISGQVHIHTPNEKNYISLKHAVALHNGWMKMSLYDMYGFTPEQKDRADAAKLVKEVKLRRNKNVKGLEASSNWVKLVDDPEDPVDPMESY